MKNQKPSYFAFDLKLDEIEKVRQFLDARGWNFSPLQHGLWKAVHGKTNICAYKSGKLCIQGKEAEDFVVFILEPEILGKLLLTETNGQEQSDTEEEYIPHAGIDESGKGDFFGPLVIAAVFVDGESAKNLAKAGVRDSKKVSDQNIIKLASVIRGAVHGKFSVVKIGPVAYNRIYDKIGNLNRLLAWGHARAIENLLEKAPECAMAVADQFGNEALIKKALLEKGKKINLLQRTKAESDIAVAAASILARETFLRSLADMGTAVGIKLPKGASAQVEEVAKKILSEKGIEVLKNLAKTHFRTFQKVSGELNI